MPVAGNDGSGAYTRAHTRTHTHSRTHAHIHTYTHTHTYTHIHTYTHAHTHTRTHTHIHALFFLLNRAPKCGPMASRTTLFRLSSFTSEDEIMRCAHTQKCKQAHP